MSKFETWNKKTKTRTQRLKPKTCKVCKTRVQTNIYYNEIKKCKHEKNKTRLQNKFAPQTDVE
jgi:hypothetical protein